MFFPFLTFLGCVASADLRHATVGHPLPWAATAVAALLSNCHPAENRAQQDIEHLKAIFEKKNLILSSKWESWRLWHAGWSIATVPMGPKSPIMDSRIATVVAEISKHFQENKIPHRWRISTGDIYCHNFVANAFPKVANPSNLESPCNPKLSVCICKHQRQSKFANTLDGASWSPRTYPNH